MNNQRFTNAEEDVNSQNSRSAWQPERKRPMHNTLTDRYPVQHEAGAHLIQFDSGGETFVFWPANERDRNTGLDHLVRAGARHYTVRSQVLSVDAEGNLRLEWRTVTSAGRYAERSAV